MMKRPRLQCVRPRVELIGTRVSSATVERKRGRAGVEDRQRVMRRDKGLCQRCLRMEPPRYTVGTQVDHIVALHKGGSNEDANKELLCDACHSEKTKADQRSRYGA